MASYNDIDDEFAAIPTDLKTLVACTPCLLVKTHTQVMETWIDITTLYCHWSSKMRRYSNVFFLNAIFMNVN